MIVYTDTHGGAGVAGGKGWGMKKIEREEKEKVGNTEKKENSEEGR